MKPDPEITLAELTPGPGDLPSTDEGRLAVLVRAQNGDATALPTLRAILDARPELADQLVKSLGITTAAEEAAVHIEPPNELKREAFRREIAAITRDLAGDPTAAVRLLARRAAFCWFALNVEEERLGNKRGLLAADLEHRMGLIDRRNQQFIESIKALLQAGTGNPPVRPWPWRWHWWRRAARTPTETSA
jgi:hypothetical protein